MTARRALAGLGLLLLLILGLVLVLTGGGDGGDADGSDRASTTRPEGTPDPTLDLSDITVAGVEDISGLDIPEDASDFLTAKLSGDQQLDVTFTIPVSAEAGFVSASGLPPLTPGNRVVQHSSPLWPLNPEGEIRGAADVRDGVNRAVELVPEGERLRARITLRAVRS